MITMKELLKGAEFDLLPEEHQQNLLELLVLLNKFRNLYGKPMFVTSPYRTMEDHLRIYRQKGIADTSKIPMKSKHLSGQACDFADPDGELKAFIMNHLSEIEQYGIWFEDFAHTPGWVHMQSVAPKSGKRFFIP